MSFHQPVLLKEVIAALKVEKNKNYVDCTFGEGGHSLEILKKNGPKGKVLGIEINPTLYKQALKRKIKRLVLVNDDFSKIKEICERENFKKVWGILFDLGLSSWHLEKSGLGFSFKKEEPLIMRYDLEKESLKDLSPEELTAAKVINEFSKEKIEEILKKYGQEKFAKRIAQKIEEARRFKKIVTTKELVETIEKAVPKWYQRQRRHFATKTFLALRVFVNKECERLEKGLSESVEVLEKGGRLAVISFHSLEDRICKRIFKKMATENKIKILTKKPIIPTKEEVLKNPRSRSAKLRVAEKYAS